MPAARVLVVDDSPTIRKVVGNVLSRAGYEVVHAADGALALMALKQEPFDLALVDFVMPRLNGFELCRKLREDPELHALPVILMSVKADKIREHFLRQTGALDALTKPFDPRALLLAVEGVLRKVDDGRAGPRSDRDPNSSLAETSERTLPDSSPPLSSLRGGAPDAFVRRLAEAYSKLPVSGLGADSDPNAIVAALRRSLGDSGLGRLYTDVVGSAASSVLSGDIGSIPLAEVLQLLQLQRQSGLLTVYTPSAEVQIAMREGLVDLATSRGAGDEFRLGRYVVETCGIARSDLDAMLAEEKKRKRPRLLGDALVAEALVTPDQLRRALTQQTSELIYDVLRWTRGRFVFDQKATRPEALAAQLGLQLASIVMEGFRRVDEWRQMEGVVGDFEQIFFRDPTALDALGAAGLARLSKEERVVLDGVDGARTLRDLVGALGMGSFDVCKILVQLCEARLVRRRVT